LHEPARARRQEEEGLHGSEVNEVHGSVIIEVGIGIGREENRSEQP
jgi:hypothetical protein